MSDIFTASLYNHLAHTCFYSSFFRQFASIVAFQTSLSSFLGSNSFFCSQTPALWQPMSRLDRPMAICIIREQVQGQTQLNLGEHVRKGNSSTESSLCMMSAQLSACWWREWGQSAERSLGQRLKENLFCAFKDTNTPGLSYITSVV